MDYEVKIKDTIDAGVCRVNNTDHRLQHVLGCAGWGWYVTKYAGGDHALEQTEAFDSEQTARAAFDALRQGV